MAFIKRKLHWALLVLVPLTFAVLGSFSHPQVAYAGWNGQQVGLYCDTAKTKVDRIILNGTNQDNKRVVFDGAPSDAQTSWVVWGWWWKGSIKAYWHIPNKGWYYTETNVPTVYALDLYTIARC